MKNRKIILVVVAVFFCLSLAFIVESATKANTSKKAEPKQTKTFHLYAANMEQEMKQGVTLYSWGYGIWDPVKNAPASPPSIPGPELRVKEGDHVRVVFHNQQGEPHTIHFHGIDNSFAGDGAPNVSQHPTLKGESFTYEFDAVHAGTYFYHCHVEPDRHPEMGLYGAFIIEPKVPKYKTDREFTLLLAERDPLLSVAEGKQAYEYVGTAAEHLHLRGDYDTADRKAKYYTINGKTDPETPTLQVKKGGTYLIRLINAGSEVHTFHTHGHHFKVVASDGRDLPNPASKDTITIGPGEKYDLLLTADNPGIWPVHCHIGPHESHGMHMMMVYDSYHEAMGHNHSDPMGKVMHHLALLKQYQFEKKYDLMKPETKGLMQGVQGFYNMLSQQNMEQWGDLESAVSAVNQQLNGKVDAASLKKALDALEEKINELQKMMQGDMS
jgi:FtsP/CotA-like multicopper oxidase with cupredoxin domain